MKLMITESHGQIEKMSVHISAYGSTNPHTWFGHSLSVDDENYVGLEELLQLGITAKLGCNNEMAAELANEFMTKRLLEDMRLVRYDAILSELINDNLLFKLAGEGGELIKASDLADYLDARIDQSDETPALIQSLTKMYEEREKSGI